MSLLTQPAPPVPRLLLTRREAAEALGVSERTLHDLGIPVKLPGRGEARTVRYRMSDLQAYVASLNTGKGEDDANAEKMAKVRAAKNSTD